MRVIDLFRDWDDNESGEISRKEFRKAMKQFELDLPKEEIDGLFDSWDPDGSGVLSMDELTKQLRRGGGRAAGRGVAGRSCGRDRAQVREQDRIA